MRRLLGVSALAILLFLFWGYVLYPLSQTIATSLGNGAGGMTFARYLSLFDPHNASSMEAVGNSLVVSLLTVLVGGCIGTFLAFAFTQIDFPLKRLFRLLVMMPLALPPLVGVLAFLFIYGESGFLPRALQLLVGEAGSQLALGGMMGILVVHVYSFSIYFYLFASSALEELDQSQLEAAACMGSSAARTFRRIVLPHLRPALVGASLLTFMASMASFSAPLIFGGGQRYITLEIYTTKLNGDMPLAAAESVLLAILAILFFVGMRMMSAERLAFRQGKGTVRFGRLPVGPPARAVLVTGVVLWSIFVVLPLAAVVLVSFAREGSWTTQIIPSAYTAENYARLITDPSVFTPIQNSIVMSLLAVAVGLLFGVTAAYLFVKGILRRIRTAADIILTIPYAIPGTVVAIALILAFNKPTLYAGEAVLVGTFWILPIAYVIRTYPLIVRSTTAALERVDDALYEAASSLGAGPWRRFRTVVLPLILPGIVSGALLAAITSVGEFVASVLLYAYSSRPISVEILSQLRAFNFGTAAAYSVLAMALILVLVALAGRVERKGANEKV